MKKILYYLLFLPIMGIGQTPTSTENYVKTKTYKQPTDTSIASPTPAQATQTVTYFDGLGRPIQQNANAQSSTGKDIITHIEYDAFGRQSKEFLPDAADDNSMGFVQGDLLKQNIYQHYQGLYNDTEAFSEKLFEASPLNRVLKQGAPGSDWSVNGNHAIRFEYQTNTTLDSVKYFSVAANWDSTKGLYDIPNTLSASAYDQFQLYKTITKDENWFSGNNNTTEEFKDKEGRVVLKRTYNNSEAHDTYYIYDQFGNLTFVLPPMVDTNQTITNTVLDNLCYQYKYDHRNRLVEKKLPGKQWEFMVYDKLDRVVMTGPVRPPFAYLTNDGWMITKYDAFDRVVMTGWMTASSINSTQRKIKQTERDNATVLNEARLASGNTTAANTGNSTNPAHSYSNLCLPTTGYYILSINYYDDYNYVGAPVVPTTLEDEQVVYYNNSLKPIGLQTGKWTKVLSVTSSSPPSLKEVSHTFYDFKARPILTNITNHESPNPGRTQVITRFSFDGSTQYTITKHKRTESGTETTVRNNYTYSDQSRLISLTHQVNDKPIELLSENSYDELGQLVLKKVGNNTSNPLQVVNYKYNIRGWLKTINDIDDLVQNGTPTDLFAFKLNYNEIKDENGYTGKKLYNGNIAETYWRTGTNNNIRKYGYFYDHLNRLEKAVYQKPNSSGIGVVTESYNESLTYDKNGNIITLKRNGGIDEIAPNFQIDNLEYAYYTDSNWLKKVKDVNTNSPSGFNDATDNDFEYGYDSYGNMIRDDNKGISNIKYNHLNLPVEIFFANGNKIEYVYNAEGKKLEKQVIPTGVSGIRTKYLEGFQYVGNVLQFFPTSEGYVNVVGSSFNYVYNYQDHLGNIRLSYTKNQTTGNLDIVEENHYYPFGLKHEGYNYTSPTSYKYKFEGQEWQDELGLGWYSFKYRNYDPAIGRFMSIDPLCEKYNWQTPYSFSSNQVVHAPELEGLESSLDFGLELEKKRYESGEVSYEDHRTMQKAGGIGAVVGAIFGVVAVVAPEVAEFVAVKVLKRAVQKEDGASSKYEPIKNESRGKEGVTNKKTDVKKADFEKNLEKEGYEKSTSKDGKATTYTKDGKSYTTRTDAKGKDAADFRKDATVPKADVKIRLGQ
jgi:RHS repeat-associated protein